MVHICILTFYSNIAYRDGGVVIVGGRVASVTNGPNLGSTATHSPSTMEICV
jgi:hypothetical protein